MEAFIDCSDHVMRMQVIERAASVTTGKWASQSTCICNLKTPPAFRTVAAAFVCGTSGNGAAGICAGVTLKAYLLPLLKDSSVLPAAVASACMPCRRHVVRVKGA